MRDPMTWAIPFFFRPFGILVKIHVLFFVVTLGMSYRQIIQDGNIVWWGDILLFTVVLLFGIILLHEFGHCFGGRAVGGEANEILIWPLGGLAFVDIPQNWKAQTITAAAGPAVNVILCALCSLVLIAAGFYPNLNPIDNPYVSEMTNYRDGRVYTSSYGLKLYPKESTQELAASPDLRAKLAKPQELNEAVQKSIEFERALAPTILCWVNRVFWLNWVLFLFNLIPAFPLDGGQILQGLLWPKFGFRTATTVACYSGFGFGVIFLLLAVGYNESLLMGLGMFAIYSSYNKLLSLDMEDGAYGDFSQGYTSLDRDAEDDDAPPPQNRGSFLKRWLAARTAKRIQKEIETRQEEDDRMDQLLDKIAKSGKASLSDEEQRFMQRVSARYRNK